MIYVYAVVAVVFLIIALFLFLPARIQIVLGGENKADIKLFFFCGILNR